ncbi:hypothetical protein [Chryseobacterium sp.]|uniref:hypothetical protein n=1 Tax=Chryseobacterium sp. TaxID=1871047 RepID=UPI0028A0128B|nr:hypothetical protein [Chryseobacterium sp.]
MELIDVNTEDKVILQHNAITSGRYDFSACQLDILFMLLSCLEVDKKNYFFRQISDSFRQRKRRRI